MRFNATRVWRLSFPPNAFGVFILAKRVWRVLFTQTHFNHSLLTTTQLLFPEIPKYILQHLNKKTFVYIIHTITIFVWLQ